MDADDGGIDHLDAVVARAGVVHRPQHHVPEPRLRPAPELTIDQVPCAEVAMKITPCGARPGDPEHPVQHQPMITRPSTAPWSLLDHEGVEEGPFLVRHQTTNQHHSPQRAALNQSKGDCGTPCPHHLSQRLQSPERILPIVNKLLFHLVQLSSLGTGRPSICM